MTSLVPFDFRCVGQLTGISLRCAPLHVCLPAEWPSSFTSAQKGRNARTNSAVSLEPVASSSATPLPQYREGPSAEASDVAQTPPNTCVPSPAASTPPAEGDSTSAPAIQTTLGPTSDTGRPAAACAPSSSTLQSKARTPRVLSLHHPSLCIETFFELRPVAVNGFEEGKEDLGVSHLDVRTEKYTRLAGRDDAHFATASTDIVADSPVYCSEVVRGSNHPNWSSIPAAALQPYSKHTQLELLIFYTGTYLWNACVLAGDICERGSSQGAELLISPSCAVRDDIGFFEDNCAAGVSPALPDLCVHRCQVDIRRTYYLGATVEEADVTVSRLLRLEQEHTEGQRRLPRPLVYLRCFDGVLVPAACFLDWQAPVAATFEEWQAARTRTFCPAPAAADFQSNSPSPSSLNAIAGRNSLAAVAAAQAAAACKELPWSRAPSSVGWRYPAFAVPRAGQPQHRVTAGDLKAATHATLAWQQLADAMEQRKGALAHALDMEAGARPAERAIAAQCAALRVQLSAARESLTLSTLELEDMRDRVEQRQRRLLQEEEALAAVQQYEASAASAETAQAQREQTREEEARRALLRAQLARGRQQRVRELCLVYSVTLSVQYANHACITAADAKDRINDATLPIMFPGGAAADVSSHLVASTADAMHEEAVALGHACHLLLVLSILYSCPLPYPILLGGSQSHVLASPNIDAAQAHTATCAMTENRKYLLSYRKVAERPLMMAGVQLLLRDGVVLAKAMGKPERRIAGCADRLGALLDLLLHNAE